MIYVRSVYDSLICNSHVDDIDAHVDDIDAHVDDIIYYIC